jgi:hypothetical protein
MTDPSKSALILIEYVNDWLSPTGGIYPAFQEREQVDTAIANSKIILEEARRRGMHVIHAALKFEPTFKVLGEAKYGLRKITRDHGAFLGEQADFFPGFEPAEGEHVVRERAGGSSVFVGTTLDGYLRNNRVFDIYLTGSRYASALSLRCAMPMTSATTPTSSTTRRPAIPASSRTTSSQRLRRFTPTPSPPGNSWARHNPSLDPARLWAGLPSGRSCEAIR